MKKHLLLSLAMVCSFQLFAAETVRLRTDVDLSVNGTTSGGTGGTIELTVEGSTNPTTEADGPKVYVPILNNNTGNSHYHLNSPGGTPSIFDSTEVNDVIDFPLLVSTPASNRYLYAAVKDSAGKYRVAKKYTAESPLQLSTDNRVMTFSLSPAHICDISPGPVTDCSSLLPTSSSEGEKAFFVYFFLSDQSIISVNDEVNMSTYNNGIYFQVIMSNKVATHSELTINITNVRTGDKRLILEYSADTGISSTYAKSIRIYRSLSAASGTPTNSAIGYYPFDGNHGLLAKEYAYGTSGELTVTDLANDQKVFLALMFVDKFQFATTLSEEKEGTPLKIDELLKKQACFLLTAGFGEEHFVITYFRNFRDHVLAHSYLGQKFINFYYESAPKYALMIYKHDALRALIRGAAYTLYFVFNYVFSIVFALSLGILLIYLYKKREKIEI